MTQLGFGFRLVVSSVDCDSVPIQLTLFQSHTGSSGCFLIIGLSLNNPFVCSDLPFAPLPRPLCIHHADKQATGKESKIPHASPVIGIVHAIHCLVRRPSHLALPLETGRR